MHVFKVLESILMYASITIIIFYLYQVAEKLMYMHEECLEGDFNSIKVLRETNVGRRPATYVRQVSIPCYRHKVCCILSPALQIVIKNN